MNDELVFEKKKACFECEKCGACCAIPGEVFLTFKEGEKIAQLIKMDFQEFQAKYMKKVWRQYVLNMPYKGGCVFWKDKKCTIYEARPSQCSTFPYWPELTIKHSRWMDIEVYCEGAKKVK